MKRKISIIIFSLLFLLFLILYLTNNINGVDNYFYNLIINIRSKSFTKFFKFITFFASIKFVSFMSILLIILYFIKKEKVYLIFLIIIIGEVILNNVIKILIGRERPLLEHLVVETSYSFPSGHTMVSVVLYGFIIYLINKTKLNKYLKIAINSFLILMISLIMISRIYLGVHYFSDVFAGMSLAIVYLIFGISYIEKRNII